MRVDGAHTHVAALRFVATGFRAGRSPDQDDFLQCKAFYWPSLYHIGSHAGWLIPWPRFSADGAAIAHLVEQVTHVL